MYTNGDGLAGNIEEFEFTDRVDESQPEFIQVAIGYQITYALRHIHNMTRKKIESREEEGLTQLISESFRFRGNGKQ